MTVLLSFLVPLIQLSAFALASPAECKTGYDWLSNSKGQNPCVVAGNVDATCRGLVSYSFPQLNDSFNYNAPSSSDADSLICECNTVMYSLVMACTYCQNVSNTQPWTYWDQHCNSVYVSQFPGQIPADTPIPHWAYLNVTANDAWSPTDAQSSGDTPESTGTPAQTNTIPSGGSSTGSGGNQPSNSAGGNSSGGKKSNAGAIAGGVVGGIAGLAIIAGLITWLVMRNKRNNAQAAEPPSRYSYPPSAPYSPPPPEQQPEMRLYSPNDPTTFPNAQAPGSLNTSNYPGTLQPQRGGYTGVAEV